MSREAALKAWATRRARAAAQQAQATSDGLTEASDGTRTYTLAALFCDDHYDRGCGQTDVVVKRTATRLTVTMDVEGYRDMLSDADYYWDCRSEMDGLEGIYRSAKRVLDVLLREGPPAGYRLEKRGYNYYVVEGQ